MKMKKTSDCTYFKELMVDALYHELSQGDNKAFQAHLKACSSCAVEYEEMAAVLDVMDQRQQPEMSETYWDTYFPRLRERMTVEAKTPGQRLLTSEWLKPWQDRFHFDLRWILYPAAAMLLVALGIGIGRYLYHPTGKSLMERIGEVTPMAKVSPIVSEHFENLRPILIDYANYTAKENNGGTGEMVRMDKTTLKKLVMQNYLLKQMVTRSNDAALKQLLEELELVLLELSNTEADGKKTDRLQTIRSVQTILNKNDVLFKMKVYDTDKDKRKTVAL
jgi:hypothetical protein